MSVSLLHTPEGVRDIYNGECARKIKIQSRLSKVFRRYGYQDIETPTFEFFDIFNKERGSVSSQEMFKFFDRDNNTLVLRPDVTPAIARCVAKYFMDETMPVRLCYRERTFINNSSYQGRLKENTQTGAELIGDGSADADAEMIVMIIDALKSAGLKEFQVELGQVEFFRGLVEEAGMDSQTQETLRELIENKNHFGVEELIAQWQMPEALRQLFLKLPELFGGIEMLRELKEQVTNDRSRLAVERLMEVYQILESYGVSGYVSWDLGMLSKYNYYTGIIFKAYTYGTGEYVVTGGRYDKLLCQFGKDAAAVGFVIVVDRLMLAIARQHVEIKLAGQTLFLYEPDARGDAIAAAMRLREQGECVCLMARRPDMGIGEYINYAHKNRIGTVYYQLEGGSEATCLVGGADSNGVAGGMVGGADSDGVADGMGGDADSNGVAGGRVGGGDTPRLERSV